MENLINFKRCLYIVSTAIITAARRISKVLEQLIGIMLALQKY